MVGLAHAPSVVHLKPEVHALYPPPHEFRNVWRAGLVHRHQYQALVSTQDFARIHAPTATGKSRAAGFFAVAPFHLGQEARIQATFAYPTNLLTRHQFEQGLMDGLMRNLGYRHVKIDAWRPTDRNEPSIPYQRLVIHGNEELRIAKLTGADMAALLQRSPEYSGKADLLEDFLDWLNQGHNFLVASPDLIAYAVHEQYGSSSFKYHSTVKRRLHSILRGRTLVLDEYHEYDPFTLINLERLVQEPHLGPKRLLLLSATKRDDFFPGVPELEEKDLPSPEGERTASRGIRVEFQWSQLPEPTAPITGLTLFIHNSVVQNRRACARLRSKGIPLVQWDGTRKDEADSTLGSTVHLVLGTSAIEVGLDLDADELVTEWAPAWMGPEQVTQRIGRIGRRTSNEEAVARIHVPGASQALQEHLQRLDGTSISKDELHQSLVAAIAKEPLRRDAYISKFYFAPDTEELTTKGFLEPGESLRYSFRPPGRQALFLDRSELPPFLFLYEKAPIVNRYEVSPPTPDDLTLIHDGWRTLCEMLRIDLERDFHIIRGERAFREWLPVPTGRLEDLRKKSLRRVYLVRNGRPEPSSLFL